MANGDKNTSCKDVVKFIIAFTTFIFLLIATCSQRWAVLKNEVTDKEIANFGLWKSCKISRDDNTETCEDFQDGNYTVFKFDNDSLENVDVQQGGQVEKLCIKEVKVSFVVNDTIIVNGTNTNVTELVNRTKIENRKYCQMKYMYSKANLERSRVFCIISLVVSFAVSASYFYELFKVSDKGFIAPLASILIPLWVLIGLGNFTAFYGDEFDGVAKLVYGWSYMLAWISGFLSIGSLLFSFALLINAIDKEDVSTYT